MVRCREDVQDMILSSSVLFTALLLLMITVGPTFTSASAYSGTANSEGWVDSFNTDSCEFTPTGENTYFFLRPGYQLTLEGEEDGEPMVLVITVLNETKVVDGIETRIVEERETVDGEIAEVSRNYFALCAPDNDIFYFGEEVDMYEDGDIVSHEGAWLAGENDARPGVIIPADPEVGDKYYQEVAPGVAEDRAEVQSLSEILDTPAGRFEDVLKVEETTPLEPGVKEYKLHAPNVGLIQDGPLVLVKYVIPEAQEPVEPVLKPLTVSVSVAGNTVQLDLNSSSTISEFNLDEANKRVTFRVDGETGTKGTTELAIGRVLEGPYTVTIDGQVTTDFEVNEVSGESILTLNYDHSVHDVTITGTNVVPEFPLAIVGLLAVMIGIGIVLARSSKAGEFMHRR